MTFLGNVLDADFRNPFSINQLASGQPLSEKDVFGGFPFAISFYLRYLSFDRPCFFLVLRSPPTVVSAERVHCE